MKNNVLFVCDTYYHVLCSVSRTINEHLAANIYIANGIPEYDKLIERLRKTNIFESVSLIEKGKIIFKYDYSILQKHKVLKYWDYAKKQRLYLKTYLPEDILKYKTIYIYNENNWIPEYLKLSHKKFITCEDACGYYQILTNHPSVYKRLPRKDISLKNRIIRWLKKDISYGPYCRYVKKMLVTSKENMFIPNRRKIKVFDFQGSIKKCIETNKKLIDFIFNNQIKINSKRKIMVFCTSSYLLESCLEKEELAKKQIDIAEKVVQLYKATYDIYIKPHPRDTVDYSSIKGATVLNKNIPFEIIRINYLNDIDKFLGIYTTSLYSLPKNKVIYFETPQHFYDFINKLE